MPDPDLTLDLIEARDEAQPQRDGSIVSKKLFRFFLGKFGPFVERFDAETFTEFQFTDRVTKLRQQLQALHR